MAGSYPHVIENDGNLGSSELVTGMLENGGDVFEAVEEMFGMIWWLGAELVNQNEFALIALEADPTRRFQAIKQAVDKAHQNYKEGLEFSKEIHRLSPDNRRD